MTYLLVAAMLLILSTLIAIPYGVLLMFLPIEGAILVYLAFIFVPVFMLAVYGTVRLLKGALK